MARHKDMDWDLTAPNVHSYEQVIVAVLMDIRDRLDVLRCGNFLTIPGTLNATQRRRKRKAKR